MSFLLIQAAQAIIIVRLDENGKQATWKCF